MKFIEIHKRLLGSGLSIFSSQEVRRATEMTSNAVRLWLIRCIAGGLIIPLKKRRGLYCFADNIPSDWLVANRLCQPSYISLEVALSYYGILPENIYSVTSVTTKITRSFQTLGKEFVFQRIKKAAFCGYVPVKMSGQTVLIAEKEKALADYLYFVFLKKKKINNRLRFDGISKREFVGYLKKFQMTKFVEWGKNAIRKGN